MNNKTNNHIIDLSILPTGQIRYKLTNDYMFRAVFQENNNALKGLLYALLNLPKESIASAIIENPIELGKSIDDKTCILDLKITLNDQKILNIEMQVTDYGDWPERSLTYLCKAFDHLKSGDEYSMIHPTIHIGIIDFNLKNLTPEFYSEFLMSNTKNHEIYSDKFSLRVLNLKQLDLIREEQKDDLYYWAKLFKATTWEEIKMLAEKNDYMGETVVTLHKMTEDEKIAEQCLARERYERDTLSIYRKGIREGRAESEAIIAEKDNEMAKLTRQLEELKRK